MVFVVLCAVMVFGLVMVDCQPVFNNTRAFALCQTDSACASLFSLNEGGSSAAFNRQMIIHGIPPGPDVLLSSFLALSTSDQGDLLTLYQVWERDFFPQHTNKR